MPLTSCFFSPGNYGVGYERFDAADGGRALNTSLWYPTTTSAAGNRQLYKFGQWNYESPFVGVTDSHELPVGESFPLVVMSAGYGGGGFSFAPLAEALASHGYVVAAPHHNTTDLVPRAREQLTTLESLIARATNEDDWLYGLIDSESLVLGGYSWGSPTTSEAIKLTEREIDAALLLDGTVAIINEIPVLHVGGGAYSLDNIRERYHKSDFYSLDVGAGTDAARANHSSFVLNRCQLRDAVIKAGVAAGVGRDEMSGTIPSCGSSSLTPDIVQDRMNQHAVEFFGLPH